MSDAMKSIVDGYVRLGDRTALEGLAAHHQLLLKQLDARMHAPEPTVTTPIVQVIQAEIAIIDLGLQRLAEK